MRAQGGTETDRTNLVRGSLREPPAADSQTCHPTKRLPSRRWAALRETALLTLRRALRLLRAGLSLLTSHWLLVTGYWLLKTNLALSLIATMTDDLP